MCASHCFCVVSVNSVAYLTFELIERANPLINLRMRKPQLASCFTAISLLVGNQFVHAADPAHPDQPIVAPAEAVSRLKEGNGRFTAGNLEHPHESSEDRSMTGSLPTGTEGTSASPPATIACASRGCSTAWL
jgi:hypothetical protein